MNLPRKCIATSLLFILSLSAATFARAAEVVATVVNLSGPLLAKKADGTAKVLALKSSVEQGDTLITEKNTYARLKFTDNGEITLRPDTQLKIDNFTYQPDKPEQDSAIFRLIKGGLRSVTGLLGKRNHERFGMNTPTATIGIRGTTFIAEYIPPSEPAVASYGFSSVAAAPDRLVAQYATRTDAPYGGMPLQLAQNFPAMPVGDGRAPGLYVQVLDGMINVSNGGGSQNFAAGQFGYTPSFQQPPVILPANPGIHFTPPPVFSSSTASHEGPAASGKDKGVDCEVR